MPILGAEYAVTRITATLQAYLPAELNIIDGEMNDGVTLDDPVAYYECEMDLGYIPEYPAIVTDVKATLPLDIKSTLVSPGVADELHSITVSAHLRNNGNEDPAVMKKRILRYSRAIVRVLAMKYPTLPNAGIETVVSVKREGEATYIMQEQTTGLLVRTATVPFSVRTYENL
jgi:hypothetical protein